MSKRRKVKSIDNLKEDIGLNTSVVKALGRRVKKSKTSNTIEIDTQMTDHDKQLNEDIRVFRGSTEGQLGSMSSGTFFTDTEVAASNYGEVRPYLIDKSAKIYNGKDTRTYNQDNGLVNIKYPELEKLLNVDNLTDINNINDQGTPGTYLDTNPNLFYAAHQYVAMNDLKSKGYDGAYWSSEDDMIPHQYQIWNTDKIREGNLNESILLEMRLSEIKAKSQSEDPRRIQKSKKVKTEYLGMSKFGILNFRTTSESRPGGYHYQTLEFKDLKPFEDIMRSGKEIMPLDIKEQIKKQDVNVWCTDESWSYWAWAHQAYKNDFAYLDNRIPDLKNRIKAPTVNNVRLNGGGCKHVISMIDYLQKPFSLYAISNDITKYLEGNKQDKYNKQPMGIINQYDQVANWNWKDIEEYTGLDKMQMLNDIRKTIQVVPSIDKRETIEDIVFEALPDEEIGMRRQIVDKVEELIQNENSNSNNK